MDGKVFCENCGERQYYEVGIGGFETIDRKGIIFTYFRMKANCVVCKNEVYVNTINDANVRSRLSAYEEARRKQSPK